MNWGKVLSGIGKVGAVAGAPFTGGASLSALPAIDGLESVLGGMAKSGQSQNNIEANRDIALERTKLDRDKFALDAPGQRLSTATRASMTNNFTPTKIDWQGPGSGMKGILPRISGGGSAAMANLDPRVRQLSSTVMDDSLAAQRRGGETGEHMDRFVDPNIGKSSLLDKIIGGTAMGGGILNAILKQRGGGNGSPVMYETNDENGWG